MRMKKQKKKSRLERQNSNNAFFMPTVMVYIIIFVTFVIWQTNEMLSYRLLVTDYEKQVIKEVAIMEVERQVEQYAIIAKLTPCIPSIYPDLLIDNPDYSIKKVIYCVRMPTTAANVPAVSTVLPIVKLIKLSRQEVTKIEYIALQGLVASLYAIERFYCWIGIPFDIGVTGPLAAAEYALVQKMPKYLIFDTIIEIEQMKQNIMVIYDLGDMEVEKIVYY
jgi:hypothetical protein